MLSHHYYSSIALLKNTMVPPTKKQSVDKRAAYLTNLAKLEEQALLLDLYQKRLKQEGISLYKDSRNHSMKRKHNNNDDELSVVSATKRPKTIRGHNAFDTAPH